MRYVLIFLFCANCFAQNVLVRFAKDCPPCPESTNGAPALTVVEYQFTSSGTFTTPWSTNWTVARYNQHRSTNDPLYNAWYAGIIAAQQNTISNNLLTVQALFQSNIMFTLWAATNRPALVMTNNGNANLVISNQIITISRILNQIGPLLKDLYKGD